MKSSKNIGKIVLIGMIVALSMSGCDALQELIADGDESDQQIQLYGMDPEEAINKEELWVAIDGANFNPDNSPNLQARLISGATIINSSRVDYVSDGQVNALFKLPDLDTPITLKLYIEDSEGDSQELPDAFTVKEYETISGPTSSSVDLQAEGGEYAFDFSQNAGCVLDSSARDLTFMVNNDGDPSITITSGGSGGIVIYQNGFSSLLNASDLETSVSNYARVGDGMLPITLSQNAYFGVIHTNDSNTAIVLKIDTVDPTNDTVDFSFMILRIMLSD